MSLSDITARLNITLKDIIALYEESKVSQRSIDTLTKFIEKNQYSEFLQLSESFAKSSPFLNHDDITLKLCTGWNYLLDLLNIEQKNLLKRVKALKEDKKADPDNIAKQEALLFDLESRKTHVKLDAARFRAMITIPFENFKNENYDYMAQHKQNVIEKRGEKK
jgi:hypothetical protein